MYEIEARDGDGDDYFPGAARFATALSRASARAAKDPAAGGQAPPVPGGPPTLGNEHRPKQMRCHLHLVFGCSSNVSVCARARHGYELVYIV